MASVGPRSLARHVFQDWSVNAGYRDTQLILAWFRSAQWALRRWGAVGRWYCAFYRLFSSLFLSVELPAELEVGPRLRIFHPHGLVLNPGVRLGSDCVLRQHVTIGNTTRRDGTERGVASAGSRVEFGAGCVVVGDIHVGDDARIAALALVTRDVPAGGVVRGTPAVVEAPVEVPPQAAPRGSAPVAP
ncbi:hypothetical protein [Pseudonocardia sp. WMMC193]|uniref:hypothetical protein n=1 Tax=Pseudonocardia sp. WMMC193 TaxID=2911965 RepID=UPI001F337961|nr:hypothetical protein [Pseudonocardia sp. WMMC193]MCF7553805.1 hypothetical protein [Pseudonocardia sp. WMMC193]